MKVQLTDYGYIQDVAYPKGSKVLKYGDIACEALNEYYGNPLTPEWQGAGKTLSQRVDALKKMRVLVNKNGVRAKLDTVIRSLPLLESDRELFKKNFSGGSTLTDLFATDPTVRFFWDGSKLIQIFDVKEVSELLIFDIAKVLEYDISIFICKYCGRYFIPSRKNERYCEEHHIEGANATKQNNLKNDRCRILRKRIYDMLSVRLTRCADSGAHDSAHKVARQNLDEFNREAERCSTMVGVGQLSEQEYYEWLCAQRERYGRYKKRPPKTDGK